METFTNPEVVKAPLCSPDRLVPDLPANAVNSDDHDDAPLEGSVEAPASSDNWETILDAEDPPERTEAQLNALPDKFTRTGNRITAVRKKDEEYVAVPICGSFTVTGRLRDETGFGWGREIEFASEDGKSKSVFVADSLLQGDPAQMRKILADAGLWLGTNKWERDAFHELINTYSSTTQIITVAKPGFHGDAKDVFVTPLGEVIGDAGVEQYRLDANAGAADRKPRGTMEDWQRDVGDQLWDPRTPHFPLALFAGCAGTLLQAAEEGSVGLHFGGSSSIGKSTAQQIGASCWTNPAPGKGILISARNTGNAMEYQFSRGNGTSLHLDEAKTGGANNKLITELAFLLASEAGKGRMKQDGAARKIIMWRTVVTLSSEKPLSTLMREAGDKQLAGASVRMPSVDVSQLDRIDPADAQAIKTAAFNNYGHVGPAFVRELMRQGVDPAALKERIDRCQALLAGNDGHPIRLRAARVFAMLWVVGDIMREAKIISASADDVKRVVSWGWNSYLSTPDAGSLDPGKDGADILLQWLVSNPGKVRSLNETEAGYQETVAWCDGETVYFPTNSFSKIPDLPTGSGAIIKELKARGLIIPASEKNDAHNYIPSKGKIRHYRIKVDPVTQRQADPTPEEIQSMKQQWGRCETANEKVDFVKTHGFDDRMLQ